MATATHITPITRALAEGVPTVEVVKYAWKQGNAAGVKPETAADEFRAIFDRDGAITPDAILTRATPDDAPLHNLFEWSDSEAATAYREQQARYLLRTLVVIYRKQDGTLAPPTRFTIKLRRDVDDPALDAATDEALEPRVYLPVSKIMGEADLRRRYVRQAWRDLLALRERYRDVSELSRVFAAMDEVQADIERIVAAS